MVEQNYKVLEISSMEFNHPTSGFELLLTKVHTHNNDNDEEGERRYLPDK